MPASRCRPPVISGAASKRRGLRSALDTAQPMEQGADHRPAYVMISVLAIVASIARHSSSSQQAGYSLQQTIPTDVNSGPAHNG
jgi:hypothetical protein